MVSAREAEHALIEGLEEIAFQCSERPQARKDWHVVKDFSATNAARCEALSAAHLLADDGFRPDLYKSFKALGRDALHRHESPREAVVASLKDLRKEAQRPQRLDWLHDYAWRELDASQRARLASMSISWLARLSSSLGNPDTSNWTGGIHVMWQFPDRGLRLEATIDATTDDGRLVMVAPSTDAAEDKVAYAAVVLVAARRQIPESVVLADLSRHAVRHSSMAELLERGVRTAEAASRVVVAASSRSMVGLDKNPSFFSCRTCPGLSQCPDGQEWLAKPVAVRGGIRVR